MSSTDMSSIDEVREAIESYDTALRRHELDVVDGWFHESTQTSRFGPTGVAYGYDEVAAGRRDPRRAPGPPVDRVEGRHELVAVGEDVVVATLEHHEAGDPARLRRTQVWWRSAPGHWRIVHAHISREGE